jgi:hypothetical protein
MHLTRPISSFLMVLVLLGVLFSQALAQRPPRAQGPQAGLPHEVPMETITVTGRLVRLMAIGGETTGWGIDLDEPRLIKGTVLKRLEVDPAGARMADFDNRGVEITGSLQQRSGIERRGYWVLVAKEIKGY